MKNRARLGAAATFSAVALLTLTSRLPFLDAGYGVDWDAWRIAGASRQIAATGVYVASRVPGHPVPEVLGALLRSGGPLAINGAVAVLSAMAAGLFALVWRRLGGPSPVAAGLALAFTPIVFLQSVCAMDHVWALALLMASLQAALSARPLVAGVALGLAIGCRPMSIMVLPTLVWLTAWHKTEPFGWRSAGFLVGSALSLGGLLFLPVLATYGWSFITFYDTAVPPSLLLVAKRATLDVWGFAGAIALAGLALRGVVRGMATGPSSVRVGTAGAWWLTVTAAVAAFIRLPHDAGYLIPAVPFVLLLLAPRLDALRVQLLAGTLLVSSLLVSITSDEHIAQVGGARFFPFSQTAWHLDLPSGAVTIDVLAGPVVLDHRRRLAEVAFAREVLERLSDVEPEGGVLLAGSRWLHLAELATVEERQAWHFAEGLSAPSLEAYAAAGTAVYFLPGARDENRRTHGADPFAHAAKPLLSP